MSPGPALLAAQIAVCSMLIAARPLWQSDMPCLECKSMYKARKLMLTIIAFMLLTIDIMSVSCVRMCMHQYMLMSDDPCVQAWAMVVLDASTRVMESPKVRVLYKSIHAYPLW